MMPPDRPSFTVRAASAADAPSIARLSGELSYPATEDAIRARLARIDTDARGHVFVAELSDGRIAGWIQAMLLELLVSDTGAAVVGLVVDPEHRNLGVGRRLLERTEDWARENGCQTVVVRSRDHRKGAHAFYERMGYHNHKRQLAFRKVLATGGTGNGHAADDAKGAAASDGQPG